MYLEKNLSQCTLVHHRFHMDCLNSQKPVTAWVILTTLSLFCHLLLSLQSDSASEILFMNTSLSQNIYGLQSRFKHAMPCYIPADSVLHSHHCENINLQQHEISMQNQLYIFQVSNKYEINKHLSCLQFKWPQNAVLPFSFQVFAPFLHSCFCLFHTSWSTRYLKWHKDATVHFMMRSTMCTFNTISRITQIY